jgi:hypothetical protein
MTFRTGSKEFGSLMAGGSVEFAASFIDSSNADQSFDEMLIVLVFVSDAGRCLSFVTDEIAIVSLCFFFLPPFDLGFLFDGSIIFCIVSASFFLHGRLLFEIVFIAG